MPRMATIPFADWRPDVALLDNQFSAVAENVYPGANAYVPVAALAAVTTAKMGGGTSGTPCGLTFIRTASGSFGIVGGTQQKLYRWSGTTWTDISRSGSSYNVASGDQWSFQQSGTKLLAA